LTVLPVFADPKTDFVFKRIFGAEERKPLLIALLNDLLELEGPRRIHDVQHLSLEQHVAVPELKLSIVDVKCTDASGRRFVVEMQVAKVEGLEKRIVYNASKAYVMQLRSAEEYPSLCDVVGVTICDFELWPKKGGVDGHEVPMLSCWRMQEQHGGARGLGQVQYVFLELPKYAAGAAPRSTVDRWAYFLREAKNFEVVPHALSERPYIDALEVTRRAKFTAEEWEAYERAKMAEQDARGMLAVAHAEGREEGKTAAKAEAVLAVLAARGIAVDEAVRARIAGCASAAVLDGWLVRAVTARSAEEVVGSS
jgi:predicted transposase/invertase (TIGR01784 family)